ncbi:helicase C-terminal domain-containing protein [Peloplasma aerotolerans]|uniref:Helicase C-terminal domain-containing protein n=1 Tax=Peloplasma aerotolerans TaxID=3044389 RepID=A0AAW6U8I6_9MOLU|nr:helicase C-terminal domain-containing protein [Mariniplasma sp. M4Ah]MDI6452787.1 helicase C-terminal domain-containing protein [Mariniplasma sp. M4Ah]
MKVFKSGVGELVSFLYSSGDLSSETFQNVSLLDGTRAHQHLQSKYSLTDQAEVPIHFEWHNDDYMILLSGRIDGLLLKDEILIIEEIKSTRLLIFSDDFSFNNEHLAQLKMYCYMYMRNNNLTDISARVTYIQLSDYQTRYFEFIFDVDLLETFFNESIALYMEWMLRLEAHQEKKKSSLESLYFPFDQYRRGQREMMSAVYQTMMEDDILYAIAPTGIGKTMASLFSTLKSLHEDNQKIFYLTAKTAGKQIALQTMDMLHEAGLHTKTLEITSKDAICFLDKRECAPEKCPFAKGFFDRLQEATKDIFDNETLLDRKTVERYARKHMVCPFEFGLYVSYYVDVIICDYNYVFDPRTHLIRYFDEDQYKPLLLIDEAHNMVSRSRDMYSSTLYKSDFIKLRRLASKLKPSIKNAVRKVLDAFDIYEEKLGDTLFYSHQVLDEDFLDAVRNLLRKIENSLKENPKYPKKTDVLEGYFNLLGFSRIYEFYNDAYLTNVERLDDDIQITIQCLDASSFILDTLKNKTYGAVFFSATLYPIEYYMKLLSKGQGETLKIQSPFDSSHLRIVLMNQISTRYQDRKQSIHQVVDTIQTVVNSKKGNYIAFFPSYQYMNQVIDQLPNDLNADLIIQEKEMDQALRVLTVDRFKSINHLSQLAFFVMGGMFAEGIDYIGDMLNGVIIVGVGLPMLNETNNQLKKYYQDQFSQGFDYAYTYPGMNKVVQAVGRVIRSDDDYGVAILIDDRFSQAKYKKLFPMEWKKQSVIKNIVQLEKELTTFWGKMK